MIWLANSLPRTSSLKRKPAIVFSALDAGQSDVIVVEMVNEVAVVRIYA